MQINSFITHKRGASVNSIQDSIAIDVEKGRFALSDGVSDSVLPEIWADILTHAYISVDDIQQFPPEGLQQVFLSQKDTYVSTLDREQRYIQKLIEKHFQTGAATFVGIELHKDVLSWQVIGDSCLFVMPDDEPLQCICSNPSHIDEEGQLIVEFDNFPHQIHSDGSMHGKWIKGNRPFKTGCILMMSDAMSAWFVRQLNQGNSPLDQLNAITDNDDFESFVEEQCRQGSLESDDESVIIIKVGSDLESSNESVTATIQADNTNDVAEIASTEALTDSESTNDLGETASMGDEDEISPTDGVTNIASTEAINKSETRENADETEATKDVIELESTNDVDETDTTAETNIPETIVDVQNFFENWKKRFSLFVKSIKFRK